MPPECFTAMKPAGAAPRPAIATHREERPSSGRGGGESNRGFVAGDKPGGRRDFPDSVFARLARAIQWPLRY